MKKISILSIDGGGIRGVIPGIIIKRLEELLRELDKNSDAKVGDYFDFIAGTSTGGILGCLYLMPDDNGRAKYSAEDAVNLYINKGDDIFSRHVVERLRSGDGIFREKYSYHSLLDQLHHYLAETRLSACIKPCLITSYDITERRAVFFTSVDAAKQDMHNFFLRDVARATSAAPTYFEPARIKSFSGKQWSLVDGGVFANNPALCAYAEVRKTDFKTVLKDNDKPVYPSAKDMIMVSLGTGSVKKKYLYDKFDHAGELKWIQPIIDILMSGNSETVDYQLKQMYNTLEPADRTNYYRIEPELCEALPEMDVASGENISNLVQAGLTYIQYHDGQLREIAAKVLENKAISAH